MTRPVLLSLVTVFALSGCKRKGNAPWEVGVTMKADVTATEVTKWFRQTEFDTVPVESKGVVGTSNSDCREVSMSTGARTDTTNMTTTITSEVVGETPWDHPLLPGLLPNNEKRTYSKVWVSVVEELVQTSGDLLREEDFNQPGNNPSKWIETENSQFGPTTTPEFYAVAADEYLIKIKDFDLWNGFQDSGLSTGAAPEGPYDWIGDNTSVVPPGIDLMTKVDPDNGDVWASVNGNYIFLYRGNDSDKSLGGKSKKADEVEIRITADVGNGAGEMTEIDVLNECIFVGTSTTDTTNNQNGDIDTEIAFLDPGCGPAGDFTHAKLGVEYWIDNVLVEAKLTEYDVTINDYGYEYNDQPGGPNSQCDRVVLSPNAVPPTLPIKDNDRQSPSRAAQLFIEYQVTRRDSVYKLKSYSEE